MAIHFSVLAWRIPGTGELDGLPSMGSHRVRHNWSDLAAAKSQELRILWRYFEINRRLPWGLFCLLSQCICSFLVTSSPSSCAGVTPSPCSGFGLGGSVNQRVRLSCSQVVGTWVIFNPSDLPGAWSSAKWLRILKGKISLISIQKLFLSLPFPSLVLQLFF